MSDEFLGLKVITSIPDLPSSVRRKGPKTIREAIRADRVKKNKRLRRALRSGTDRNVVILHGKYGKLYKILDTQGRSDELVLTIARQLKKQRYEKYLKLRKSIQELEDAAREDFDLFDSQFSSSLEMREQADEDIQLLGGR